MNKKATAIFLALLTVGMVGTASAQTLEEDNNVSSSDADNVTSEGSDITVSISSTTAIDVKPNALDFTGLNVGEQVTEENDGGTQFGSFTLENIGSEYIDRVWAEATHPTTDPFGTGDPSNYDAGNFLQIKPSDATPSGVNGDDSIYHYVNRWEFANSWNSAQGQIPSYIRASPSEALSGDTAADTYVGRLSAGDEWYFYTIVTGSSNDVCDGSQNAELRLGNSKHSSSDFGTVDFTHDGGDYSTFGIEQTDGEHGVTDATVSLTYNVDGSDVTREYDLLTRCDMASSGNDPHTIRTRYNVRAGDVGDITASKNGTTDATGSRSQFLVSTGTAADMLLPGEQLIVDAAVEVPQGVPQGGVQTGSLTFFVTSDQDAQN